MNFQELQQAQRDRRDEQGERFIAEGLASKSVLKRLRAQAIAEVKAEQTKSFDEKVEAKIQAAIAASDEGEENSD